jgi:DNA repair exonuclease SbcCD ATPase subunit
MFTKHNVEYFKMGLGVIVMLMALTCTPSNVSAEATTTKQIRLQGRTQIQQIRAEAQDERQQIRDTFKSNMSIIKNSSSTSDEKRDERKAEVEKRNILLRATATSTRAEVKEIRADILKKVQERKDELRSELKVKLATKKQKLQDAAIKRIQNRLANVYERLHERIQNLVTVDAKLTDKINALTNTGTSTANMQTLLATAKSTLEVATTDVAATKAISEDQLSASSTSKEALTALITKAQTSVKSAAEAYRKVVQALRPFFPKPVESDETMDTANATSTN